MKMNSTDYFNKYNQIKVKPEYAFDLAQAFVSEILSLEPEQRFALLPLLKQVDDEAFDKGFEIPNLDFFILENEHKNWIESQTRLPIKKKEKKVNTEDDFNILLIH